jgi:hypothetical protein
VAAAERARRCCRKQTTHQKEKLRPSRAGADCGRASSIPPFVCLEIDCRRDAGKAARAPQSPSRSLFESQGGVDGGYPWRGAPVPEHRKGPDLWIGPGALALIAPEAGEFYPQFSRIRPNRADTWSSYVIQHCHADGGRKWTSTASLKPAISGVTRGPTSRGPSVCSVCVR